MPPLSPVFDPRQQIADRLIEPIRRGKPELGWSGDPLLAISFHRIEQRWELWRNEPVPGNPDRHVLIARGPVGQDINEDAINILISKLVQMDTHRAGNSAAAIDAAVDRENARLEASRERQAVDATGDALAKFYYEAGKAMGVTRTEFYT
jgi:hypothetical protein